MQCSWVDLLHFTEKFLSSGGLDKVLISDCPDEIEKAGSYVIIISRENLLDLFKAISILPW